MIKLTAMRDEKSFGIVPIHQSAAGPRFLLVQHRKGHWGFPKGKPDEGEMSMDTAIRELREETGIADALVSPYPTFTETYRFVKKKSGEAVNKTVMYFLGYVDCEDVTVMPGELLDHAWSDAAGTAAKLTYSESQRLFEDVLTYLASAD